MDEREKRKSLIASGKNPDLPSISLAAHLSLASSNSFIQFHGSYRTLLGLSIPEILIVEFIHNYARMTSQKGRWYGELEASIEKIRRKTTLDERTQQRAINALQKRGYLEMFRSGLPAKRFLRFNYLKFYVDYEAAMHDPTICRDTSRQIVGPSIYTIKNKNNTSRIPASDRGRAHDDGFYEESTPVTQGSVLPIDYINASELHEVIITKLNYRQRWNRTKWNSEMRLLRQELGNDAARLSRVLEYYKKHASPDFKPKIINAKQFRKHFIWIENIMGKEGTTPKHIQITPQAQELAKNLTKLKWPKGSADQLPAFIQVSLDNLKEFLKKRRDIEHLKELNANKNNGVPKSHMEGLIERLSNVFIDVEGFIKRWCVQVFSRVENWDKWSGNLMPFVFKIGSKHFDQIGKEWTGDYMGSGRASVWYSYKELINES